MMSPASMVRPRDSDSMITSTGKIMFAVVEPLLLDAVDPERNPLRLRIAELVGGDDDRAHGAEAVEALALEPLQVASSADRAPTRR